MTASRSTASEPVAWPGALRPPLWLLGVCASLSLTPVSATAQARGTIVGTVTSASTGAPVPAADVVLRGRRDPTRTDSTGGFRVVDVAPGVLVVQIRALGFASASRIVELASGSTARLDVALQRVTELPGVAIEDSAPKRPSRFVDFAQRRRAGRGQFLTREQIERANAINLTELLRPLRGVRVNCAGTTCTLQMARSPNGCLPEYIVDGRPSAHFGPTTPVGDLEAVELYVGPSETPAEYVGQGGCGTVVLWTKSSP